MLTAPVDLSEFDLAQDQPIEYLTVDRQSKIDETNIHAYSHFAKRLNTSLSVEENSTISISFDPEYERVIIHTLQVWRNGMVRDLLNISDFDLYRVETERDRLIYSGRLQMSYLLPDIRVGDVVEQSFSVVGKNSAIGRHATAVARHSFRVPVRHLRDRLLFPQGYPVHLKAFAGATAPERITADGFEIYQWDKKNVPGVFVEKNTPRDQFGHSQTHFTSFGDWSEVGAYFAPFYDVSGPKPAEAVEIATKIKSEHAEEADRLRAALGFVQSEIRYMGIELGAGGYIPRSPQLVLDRRFGDCKDMAVLLTALLDELGIDAAPLLVDLDLRGGVEALPPSHGAFNHVIVVARLADKFYFLDPTRGEQLGDLNHLQQGDFGKGVVISPDSPGMIDAEAPRPEFFKKISDTFHTRPDSDAVRLVNVSEYFMHEADSIYENIKENGLGDVDRNFLEYYQRIFPGLEQIKPLEMEVFNKEGRIRFVANYAIPKAWSRDEDNEDIRTFSIRPDDLLGGVPDFVGETRETAYAIAHPIRAQQKLEVVLDDTWTLTNSDQTFDHPALRYDITERFHANTLIKTFSYVSKSNAIAPEDFKESMSTLEIINNNSGIFLTEDTNNFLPSTITPEAFEAAFLIYYVLALAGSVVGAYLTRDWDVDWRREQAFYPVSLAKFIVLNVITLGAYQTYWFYKNWLWIRETKEEDISPFLRASFFVFSNFSLFPRFARSRTEGPNWFGPIAIPLAVLILLSAALDRYMQKATVIPDAAMWIALLAPLLPVPAAVQVLSLNKADETHVARNSKFSWPVILMMLAFSPLFLVTVYGLFP